MRTTCKCNEELAEKKTFRKSITKLIKDNNEDFLKDLVSKLECE
jgi:hypothetical protein